MKKYSALKYFQMQINKSNRAKWAEVLRNLIKYAVTHEFTLDDQMQIFAQIHQFRTNLIQIIEITNFKYGSDHLECTLDTLQPF